MTSKQRDRTILLFFCSCILSYAVARRNGDWRDYDNNGKSTTVATASASRSTEEQMKEVGHDYDLTSSELNGPPPHNVDWDMRPNVICLPTGPNEKSLCRCSTVSQRKIDCRNATLKNGRPLDTAFLSLKDGAKFSAEIVDLSGNEIQLLRKQYIVPLEADDVLVLDASHNWISDVEPYALDHFPKLATLQLSDNRLGDTELSDDWLTKRLGATLHQLYLDYNYFVHIDDGIFDNLINLRKLVLSGNFKLQLTRHTFGESLAELRTISLDYCGIQTLDEDIFKRLPNLRQLSLSGNPITAIVPALRHVPKLSILSLSETQLETVPKHAFKNNPQLKRIYMRHMRTLSRVDSCAFCGLDDLEVLDLSNASHLTSIDNNAFGGSSDQEVVPLHVAEFHLSNCNLTSVDVRLLQWHPIHKLGFSGNRWDCSCSLYWLIGNRNLHKFVGEPPRCETPKTLKDMTLNEAAQHMSCSGTPAQNAENEGGSSATIIGGILFVAVVVVTVGGVALTRRHDIAGGASAVIQRVRKTLPAHDTGSESPFGYANLDRAGTAENGAAIVGANVDDYDVDDTPDASLENDFHRPEFV